MQMSLAFLAGVPSAGTKTAERPASRGRSQSSWKPLTWSAFMPLPKNPLSTAEGRISKVRLKPQIWEYSDPVAQIPNIE